MTFARWINYKGKLKILVKVNGEWTLLDPNFKPYFFIKKEDVAKTKVVTSIPFEIEDGDFVTFDENKKAVKIIVNFPSDVKLLRKKFEKLGIKTFEADIPFIERWMIDNNYHAAKNPRILFFDIEMDARKGLPLPDDPETRDQQLISISAVDDQGKDFFFCEDDEYEILVQFAKLVLNYDLIMGWNIERFDVPMLEYKYSRYELESPFKFASTLDMMLIYKNLFWTGRSAKLDDVAEQELGVGKAFSLYEVGGAETMWQWFLHDRGKLYEYNIVDSILLWKLWEKWNEKYGLKEMIGALMERGHVFYDAFLQRAKLIDSILLRRVYEMSPRVVLRSKVRNDNEEDITGAIVLDPVAGIWKNVAVFDFSSMYPSIIISFNISPETADENGEIISGKLRFKQKPYGLLPSVLKNFFDMRIHYKELLKKIPSDDPNRLKYAALQNSLKVLINSMYGVMAYSSFRLYYPDVAESVTLTGQLLLKTAKSLFEKHGYSVLYGDTDSLFVKLKSDKPQEEAKDIVALVNNELKEYLITHHNVPKEYYMINLDVDKIFSHLYLPNVKKRYFGKLLQSVDKEVASSKVGGEYYVKGFELKRGDVPPLLKRVQEKIFEILLFSETTAKAENEIRKYLSHIKEMLYAGFLDTELIMRKSVTKKFAEYKTTSPHIKAAMQLGSIRPGDAISFVITGQGKDGLISAPVLEGKPLPKIRKDGYDYYWERVLDLVERIVGYRIDPSKKSILAWFE